VSPESSASCTRPEIYCTLLSALEDAVRRLSRATSSGVFSGKGQTLGGKQAPIDNMDVKGVVNQASSKVTDLSPQVKIFLGLAGAYVLFWYLS
jgi:thioredoxin 1